MRTLKTVALGLIPVICGWLMQFAMRLPLPAILWQFFGLACLVLWGVLAFCTAVKGDRVILHCLKMNAVGLVMLVLILIQELTFGRYWLNPVGLCSQFYFQPCLPPVFRVFDLVTGLAPAASEVLTVGTWLAYLAEFVLMAAASWIGAQKKLKGGRRR